MNNQDIRNHVIKHVKDTLKHQIYSTTNVTEILSTIEEEPEDSETGRDEIEEAEKSLNDSDLYAGFDEDGYRITDEK